jgi:hypothetical protein
MNIVRGSDRRCLVIENAEIIGVIMAIRLIIMTTGTKVERYARGSYRSFFLIKNVGVIRS